MKTLNEKSPQGFGVRQPSGALVRPGSRLKSDRGLSQSKTLSRLMDRQQNLLPA